MGAAVVLSYALTHATALRALVLIAPAIGTSRPAASSSLLDFADQIEAIGLAGALDERRKNLKEGGIPPEEADGFGAQWARQDEKSLAVAMRAVGTWRLLCSFKELERLKVPVLIVDVRDDPLHPIQVAEEMDAHIVASSLFVFPSHQLAVQPGAIGGVISRELASLWGT
jgi:pimeloyl-ACP methyl ester carboxylesterase